MVSSKMIGKVETDTINREKKKKTIVVVLAVEVKANITHINPKQTSPLKMTKKNDQHQLKLRKMKGAKSYHFFVKQDHTNKDKKKDLKRWKLKIMTKARPVIMINKMNIP